MMDALFEIESPAAKAKRIEGLERPLHDFNYRVLLEDIWERQSGEAIKDLVSIRTLWQSRDAWRYKMDIGQFTSKLTALAHFAGSLMVLDTQEKVVHITQHPDR